MFDNIGSKLKSLATVSTVLGIAAFVILGVILMFEEFLSGLLVLVFGSVFSWIGSFTIYGLGQLIENTDQLVHHAQEAKKQPAVTAGQWVSVPQPVQTAAGTAQPVRNASAPAVPQPLHAPAVPILQYAVKGIPVGAGRVRCPQCKVIQKEENDVCTSCFQPLIPVKKTPPVQQAPLSTGTAASETPVAGNPAGEGKISCPVCGTVQNANRRVCLHCGQKLLPDAPL